MVDGSSSRGTEVDDASQDGDAHNASSHSREEALDKSVVSSGPLRAAGRGDCEGDKEKEACNPEPSIRVGPSSLLEFQAETRCGPFQEAEASVLLGPDDHQHVDPSEVSSRPAVPSIEAEKRVQQDPVDSNDNDCNLGQRMKRSWDNMMAGMVRVAAQTAETPFAAHRLLRLKSTQNLC